MDKEFIGFIMRYTYRAAGAMLIHRFIELIDSIHIALLWSAWMQCRDSIDISLRWSEKNEWNRDLGFLRINCVVHKRWSIGSKG